MTSEEDQRIIREAIEDGLKRRGATDINFYVINGGELGLTFTLYNERHEVYFG